jgi:hypothetical protein
MRVNIGFMKNSNINQPIGHKEPHTYKDLCSCKYSSVKDHSGEIPGVKESDKKFYDLWRQDKE